MKFAIASSLVITGLWIRSRYVWDIITHEGATAKTLSTWKIFAVTGGVECSSKVMYLDEDFSSDPDNLGWRIEFDPPDDPTVEYTFYETRMLRAFVWTHMGFEFKKSDETIIGSFSGKPSGHEIHFTVVVPYWGVLVVSLATALVCGAAQLSGRRRAGDCDRCGYDLRATPNRCPECGTIPADASSD